MTDNISLLRQIWHRRDIALLENREEDYRFYQNVLKEIAVLSRAIQMYESANFPEQEQA